MQIDNGSDLLNIYASAQNKVYKENKTSVNGIASEESNSLSFKSMTRDQIQSYFKRYDIEDSSGRREDAIIGLQKFSNTLEPNTYNKMVDALLLETDSSQASMRYSSFPLSEMLFEDPKLFHVQLETTLDMQEAEDALIFSLDLKKDFENYMLEISTADSFSLEKEEEFPPKNFMGFLLKKFEQMQTEYQKELLPYEQNRLDDYTSLLKNYNDYDDGKHSSLLEIMV